MADSEPLVVWINDAFGVGKTAVGEGLLRLLPGSILFDPEGVGLLLRSVVPADGQADDFQDIPAWRSMTCATVVSLARARQGAIDRFRVHLDAAHAVPLELAEEVARLTEAVE